MVRLFSSTCRVLRLVDSFSRLERWIWFVVRRVFIIVVSVLVVREVVVSRLIMVGVAVRLLGRIVRFSACV